MKNILMILLLLGAPFISVLSSAEQSPSLSVLENAQQDAKKQQAIIRDREQQFQQTLAEQKRILKKLEKDLALKENRSEQLETRFNNNESKLLEKQQIYEERLGAFNELLGVVKQVSADTQGQFENSLISTHNTARLQRLKTITENKTLPSTDDLSSLWQLLLMEMQEQGRSLRYETEVIDGEGHPGNQTVVRIGPFLAFNQDGKFLNYSSTTMSFNELSRQPRKDYQRAAKNYFTFDSEGETLVPIDPSRGAILSLLIQRPSIQERIQQGGAIAYIILVIAAFGLLLAAYRLVFLARIGRRLRQQLNNLDQPVSNNALGQILEIAKNNPSVDIESLELKFDDIILKSASRLRRGLGTLKVLAGMAPLLGLLGTVTGMIETFQVITLFGSGDARLMAGGISQALVTTALGLSTAIPVLLLHSIANSRSRILVELMEEQAAGIVAEHAHVLSESSPHEGDNAGDKK
jgi:biopolymer transport protein ExbB